MREDDVREYYINKNMTLVETARKLNVNLTVLHSFITAHNLVKDNNVINKFHSSHNVER